MAALLLRAILARKSIGNSNPKVRSRRWFTANTGIGQTSGQLGKDQIANILRTSQAVCFDVDSTVIPEEGIDELASFKGAGEAVAEWTHKAMGGQVLFEDALAARLDIIRPSQQDVAAYLSQNHPPRLTPGVKELIDTLHSKGKIVYLVSGGFRQMIEPVADLLNIPLHRIYANNILFDEESGAYAGFDSTELTSRDGGKPAVVQKLKDDYGYSPVVMVGDGVTDMQAKPPASLFIGFGGITVRENVQQGADWFVTDFQDVVQVLNE
eukprot:CAMPEP_0174968248 /NCGR_PEP_ID=MMETSP0004_2-20121128/8026_1 /TAXON_ID=420556 /ORGANISM="Ochromonas sp., Strain CCMP1393" /LENGTH=266 /DNA_ID=CAMNT_0016217455 /DNA_START=169 /DNA_END=969 /DNA_ORIENTATION=-